MKGHFLLDSNEAFVEGNIYADKSAIVLDWLLHVGINREKFSIREVAKEQNVSVGLVQRIFVTLVLNGLLQTEGVRTAKRFFLKKPYLLLKSWVDRYSILKRCKIWTYRSGLQGKDEIFKAVEQSSLSQTVALALHSAAEAHGCKNTNLNTFELYMLDSALRLELEDILQLEPQEEDMRFY